MTDKAKSGIQLRQISLVKSEYVRANHLTVPDINDFTLDISIEDNKRDNYTDVFVNVKFLSKDETQRDDFFISVSMAGVFEQIGDVPFTAEQFAKVNAPAIIYPYIRQHIRSLSLESGIAPIILPVVNFQAWYDEANSKKN